MQAKYFAEKRRNDRILVRNLCIILFFCLSLMSFIKILLKSIFAEESALIYINFASSMTFYALLVLLVAKHLNNNGIFRCQGLRNFGPRNFLFTLIFGGILFAFTYGQHGVEAWLLSRFDPNFAYAQWPFKEGSIPTWISIDATFTVNLLIAIIIAPLVEEFYFRGLLFTAFSKLIGVHKAAIVNGGIFILMHLQHPHVVSTFIFAVSLCYLYTATRSIVLCAVAHSIYNSLALIAENLFLEARVHTKEEIIHAETWHFEFIIWGISVIFLTLIFYNFLMNIRPALSEFDNFRNKIFR